jgi:flagella basal body P-ring formation protein FlgA
MPDDHAIPSMFRDQTMTIDIESGTTTSPRKVRNENAASAAGTPVTPQPPRIPGRRNPKWIALGIVALCLGGLLSYMIYAQVASETAVVAAAHTVYRGETIEQGDLTTITLRGGSLPQTIPATRLTDLVGKRAAYDLIEGSVIPSSAVVEEATPAEGRAIVGLKLALGRAPGNLLLPSSVVRLIALPAAADSSATDKLTDSIFVGRVIDQSPAADGTSLLVNVDVEAGAAPTIAALAAQDRIAIVRDAGR